jgi:hypothetical protein
LVGCMFGALLNLYVGDWLGRKKTIYVYVPIPKFILIYI